MGMFMSFMGKGLPTAQMLSLVMGTLHRQFIEKDIKSVQEFHIAILDIFSTVNSALPGKHYNVPSPKEVEACFQEWKEANESEKRKIFIDFMMRKVSLSRLDDSTLVTGIVTPPAAMAAKRAGESLPQLKLIKMIPDVNVGGCELMIDTSDLWNPGTIIDSGVLFTRLPMNIYRTIRDQHRNEMMNNYGQRKLLQERIDEDLDTCYNLSTDPQTDIPPTPSIRFIFNGGVTLTLYDTDITLYEKHPNVKCLAFVGNKNPNDLAILGNFQLRNLEVVYDYVGNGLGFRDGACS